MPLRKRRSPSEAPRPARAAYRRTIAPWRGELATGAPPLARLELALFRRAWLPRELQAAASGEDSAQAGGSPLSSASNVTAGDRSGPALRAGLSGGSAAAAAVSLRARVSPEAGTEACRCRTLKGGAGFAARVELEPERLASRHSGEVCLPAPCREEDLPCRACHTPIAPSKKNRAPRESCGLVVTSMHSWLGSPPTSTWSTGRLTVPECGLDGSLRAKDNEEGVSGVACCARCQV